MNLPIRKIVLTSSLLFLIIAAAKIISAFSESKILAMPDPVLNIPYKYLFLIVGGLELAVACICLFSQTNIIYKVGLLAWFSTILLTYRIGLYLIAYQRPCACLGNLTDSLHIKPELADRVMVVILAYLLITSYACLFTFWGPKRALKDGNSEVMVGSE